MLDAAAEESLSGLRDKCGRVKAAADRDPEATNRRIHAERYLRYGKGTDGAVNGSFRLTPQAGAKFDAFLQPFIQAQARKAKAERRRDTLDQLSADAFVAMAEAAVHGPATKTTRPQVNVIVDRDALLRGHTEGEERCEFSTCFGSVPVPVSVVQEILDDAFLVGLFHDGVDVQAAIRFGRHTAAAVKDALRVRDDFTCLARQEALAVAVEVRTGRDRRPPRRAEGAGGHADRDDRHRLDPLGELDDPPHVVRGEGGERGQGGAVAEGSGGEEQVLHGGEDRRGEGGPPAAARVAGHHHDDGCGAEAGLDRLVDLAEERGIEPPGGRVVPAVTPEPPSELVELGAAIGIAHHDELPGLRVLGARRPGGGFEDRSQVLVGYRVGGVLTVRRAARGSP